MLKFKVHAEGVARAQLDPDGFGSEVEVVPGGRKTRLHKEPAVKPAAVKTSGNGQAAPRPAMARSAVPRSSASSTHVNSVRFAAHGDDLSSKRERPRHDLHQCHEEPTTSAEERPSEKVAPSEPKNELIMALRSLGLSDTECARAAAVTCEDDRKAVVASLLQQKL